MVFLPQGSLGSYDVLNSFILDKLITCIMLTHQIIFFFFKPLYVCSCPLSSLSGIPGSQTQFKLVSLSSQLLTGVPPRSRCIEFIVPDSGLRTHFFIKKLNYIYTFDISHYSQKLIQRDIMPHTWKDIHTRKQSHGQ